MRACDAVVQQGYDRDELQRIHPVSQSGAPPCMRPFSSPSTSADPDTSKPAVARAAAMAKAGQGQLRLVYVRSIMPVTYMEFVPPQFDEQTAARGRGSGLRSWPPGVDLPDERVSSVVRLGSIYHEVLDEADKCGADLIVIGSHRPSMSTYLLGSNAHGRSCATPRSRCWSCADAPA